MHQKTKQLLASLAFSFSSGAWSPNPLQNYAPGAPMNSFSAFTPQADSLEMVNSRRGFGQIPSRVPTYLFSSVQLPEIYSVWSGGICTFDGSVLTYRRGKTERRQEILTPDDYEPDILPSRIICGWAHTVIIFPGYFLATVGAEQVFNGERTIKHSQNFHVLPETSLTIPLTTHFILVGGGIAGFGLHEHNDLDIRVHNGGLWRINLSNPVVWNLVR